MAISSAVKMDWLLGKRCDVVARVGWCRCMPKPVRPEEGSRDPSVYMWHQLGQCCEMYCSVVVCACSGLSLFINKQYCNFTHL